MNRKIYISVDLEDMQWAADLVKRFGLGLEIVDFMRSQNLDKDCSEIVNKWKSVLSDLPEGTAVIAHGPFYDLYPFSFDRKVASVARDRYVHASECAALVGATAIVFHSGFLPCITNKDYSSIWIERNLEFWTAFLKDVPEMTMLIENMWDPSPDHLERLCDSIQSDRLGICFDIGHANVYSKVTQERWLEVLAAQLLHVHVNDNRGLDDEELALGAGNVNYHALAALALHKNTSITIETLGAEAVETSYQILQSMDLHL